MKTRTMLACPGCNRTHRTWHALATCRWRNAAWIAGSPPATGPCYACVSACSVAATVTLFAIREEAEVNKATIDETGCGHGCHGQHLVMRL